jgi:hypothetical protein
MRVGVASDLAHAFQRKRPAGKREVRPRVFSRSELEGQVAELIAQQAAISEVLRAIANSPWWNQEF